MMLFNIARNASGNQMFDTQALCDARPDVRRTHGHEGPLQRLPSPSREILKLSLTAGRSTMLTTSYRNYSFAQNLIVAMPLPEGPGLVRTDDQHQLESQEFALQFIEGVHRVAGPGTVEFALVHHHPRQAGKGQLGHRQSMLAWRQARPVRSLPCWQHVQPLQAQLLQRRLSQCHVRPVRGVEGPAEHPQTWPLRQTHAWRTRKCSYKRASGVPAAGACW